MSLLILKRMYRASHVYSCRSFIEVEVKGSVRCISGKHQYMKAPVVPDWLDLAPMIVARKFHGVVEVGKALMTLHALI